MKDTADHDTPTPRAVRDATVESLGARAAGGDAAALDELLRLVEPLVLRNCARFLPNRQDAEEACQDTLLAVARTIQTFEGRARFSTWLYTVTANRARSTYRSLKLRSVPIDNMAERPDPRRTSVIAGSRVDLLEALDAIGPRFAQAIALRDVLGLDYAEIARTLDLPEGTVKSRIHEGRTRMQRKLAG